MNLEKYRTLGWFDFSGDVFKKEKEIICQQ